HIELLYLRRISLTEKAYLEKSCSLADFAYRIDVSREMMQFYSISESSFENKEGLSRHKLISAYGTAPSSY
ncbi:hypothetical protein M5W90_20340, partial [Paenibacillus thiaminolyticus]